MREQAMPLSGARFAIVGKGGSGKSTVTVVLAEALRRSGHEVCVLDADSTNIGLHRALGLEDSPGPLLDYFGGMVFSGGAVTCPVDDPTPLAGAELDLERLPARYHGLNAEGIHLLVAGKIGDKGPGAGCDGPISKIARDVRIRIGDGQPVTLVDFKAGFEDSARGTVNGVDWAVAVVDPTNAAIQMALDLRAMVEQTRAGVLPATGHLESPDLVALARRLFSQARVRDVLVVLNKVRDREMEAFLTERLAVADIRPLGTIPEDSGITTSWLKGEPLNDWARGPADRIVAALAEVARQTVPMQV